jgi:tripartite-type tricarboxylate transporter receptor subunit TctC
MDRIVGVIALLFGAISSVLVWANEPAAAQTLQNRPVKLVVPYAPGGPGDVAARLLGQEISPILGVPVVVENKTGATGKIAAETVKSAEPDGHTLLLGGTPQLVILPLLDKDLQYKALEDFQMISRFCSYDIIFMTGEPSGIKTMKQLVERMRAKANNVSFASIGQAHLTSPGLAYLILEKMYQGKAQEINYRGQAPGVVDLLTGLVTFGAYSLTGTLQHIQSGKLIALAVASPRRLPELPDVPTMAEAGFPEFDTANNWVTWLAVAAPAKTHPAIVSKINQAIAQVARSQSFQQKMAQAGLNVMAIGDPAQEQAAWREDYERLATTLKRFDIRAPE